MPSFNAISEFRLQTCDPELIFLFNEVVKTFDCTILEGYRGKEAQEKAFNEGNSKLHYPHGKHNQKPSQAVDVSPHPLDWKNLSRFFWFAGFVMGTAEQLRQQGKMKNKIRYGGDWNRNYDITDEKGLRDLVHFEIEG